MKETHLFFAPQTAIATCTLPPEEAAHAVRVLRMREGDELTLTDGEGHFFNAHITLASPKGCSFEIDAQTVDTRLWKGGIHLAVAPTKNMDRMEWLAEKATEIGLDTLSLLNCKNSERRVVKTERLEKICIGAMKQSHKAFLPHIEGMTDFKRFVERPFAGEKFIAHCHEALSTDGAETLHLTGRNFLGDKLSHTAQSLVLIGPEGDFTLEEVELALAHDFQPISLGESRLRTETAALVAVHLMYLAKRTQQAPQ